MGLSRGNRGGGVERGRGGGGGEEGGGERVERGGIVLCSGCNYLAQNSRSQL